MTQTDVETWRDPGFPVDERVTDLLGRMTLAEKLAQLGSVWMGAAGDDGGGVAPMQDLFFSQDGPSLDELIKCGMGQLTRVFGTRPVTPAEGMRALAALQARVMAASRFGIPAVAHEECLTGFAAWTATIFPTPLAWGASFDPALVRDMARAIGAAMRAVGVHQGLAPVLDVTRDPRWGRTEETIGEDPYLVGSIGTGYVQGLQAAGVQATLKHFAAYSASRAGRNMAPVSMGPRELADVILPPFEMAIRLGGARSVMPSYVDIDGVPASADPELLSTLLRDRLGFDGLVVSDYYAVSFLELQHAVAADPAGAARWPSPRASTWSCPPCAATGNRCARPSRTATSTWRSWTGRSPACCGRSSSSACSTPAGPPSRMIRPRMVRISTSTRPRTGRWPAASPRSPSCCSPTTAARSRWPPRAGKAAIRAGSP